MVSASRLGIRNSTETFQIEFDNITTEVCHRLIVTFESVKLQTDETPIDQSPGKADIYDESFDLKEYREAMESFICLVFATRLDLASVVGWPFEFH